MSDIDANSAGEVLHLTAAELSALQRGEPSLPAITSISPDVQTLMRAVTALKEIVETREGRRGAKIDAAVTWRDLFVNGIADFTIGGRTYTTVNGDGSVVGGGADVSTEIPGAPQNVRASGALSTILIEWDEPTYTGHAYAEIWRSATDNIGTAVMVGQSPTTMYVDSVGGSANYYYWVRFVSAYPKTGPFHAVSGLLGQTGVDPSALLELLTGEPDSPHFNAFPFIIISTATVINGVNVPAGVYMADAFIANGTVTNAKIGNAAIDTAKIADLAVSNAKIADAAISTAKIGNAQITNALIANGAIANANITDGAITNAKIADATIAGAKIANAAITDAQIANGAITTAKIADAQITNAKVASAAIKLANIDTASITSLSALTATIGTLRTAASGARLEISDNVIKVYDSNGVLRVKMGNLSL